MVDDETLRDVNRSWAAWFDVRYLAVVAENLPGVLLIFDAFFYQLLVEGSDFLMLLLFYNLLDKVANEV